IIPELAPAEVAFLAERPLRSRAKPHLPVEIALAHLGLGPVLASDARYRGVPHSFRGIPVVTDQSPENFPDFSRLDIVARLPAEVVARTASAHLQDPLGLLDQVVQLGCLLD